ncbi:hypothetical protein DL96DRAFT_1704509 [Flagelloscypha sp. PMI_526]|nr:hypothetical protein DL96DRAFT_1704509 [Flagelloscypha sp. PMI_526]
MSKRNVTGKGVSLTQLCDHCHTQPRFGTFSYCSKTCAGLAKQTTPQLCKNCNQKPPYPGHDYCGQRCAAKANPASQQAQQQFPTVSKQNPPNGSSSKSNTFNGAKGSGKPKQRAPQGNDGSQTKVMGMDPFDIARIVAQQFPQAQPIVEGISRAVDAFSQDSTHRDISNMPQRFVVEEKEVSRWISPPEVSGKDCDCSDCVPHSKHAGKKSKHPNSKVQSTGIDKTLCIMCQKRPQSRADYFCGTACRQEALNKASLAEDNKETLTESESESDEEYVEVPRSRVSSSKAKAKV